MTRAWLVRMTENLSASLTPYRRSAGPVAPWDVTLKRGRKPILQAAGEATAWPQDVLRHSFATYHMAVHAHEGRCAEIMGNSPAVIQHHYKGLASEQAGKEYFALEPPAPATLTVLPATA